MIQTLFGSLQPENKEEKTSLFDRMKQAGRANARKSKRPNRRNRLFRKEIDSGTLDDLEASLVSADLGINTSQKILETLRERADHKQIKDAGELKRILKAGDPANPYENAKQNIQQREWSGGRAGGGRERHRQNHYHRQTGQCAATGRKRQSYSALADTFRAASDRTARSLG